jgi:hypothetical protein
VLLLFTIRIPTCKMQPLQPRQDLGQIRSRERVFALLRTPEFSDSFDALHLPFPSSAEERILLSDRHARRKSHSQGHGSKSSLAAEEATPKHNVRNHKKASRAYLNPDQPNFSQTYHNKTGHSLGTSLANDSSESCQRRLNHSVGPKSDLVAEEASLKPGLHQLSSDPIVSLPSEISDLILSYLSPAALDAARHTCKAWYHAIMSNDWVLSCVLGTDGGSSHRDLLKVLGVDSNLFWTFKDPDAWRTRFRMRDLQFLLPEPGSRYVSATRIGSQFGFMVFQLSNERPMGTDPIRTTLVIYRFDWKDLAQYAGSAEHDGTEGTVRIISMTKMERDTPSVLRIDIGDIVRLYSITVRKAFSNFESRFSLEALGSPEDAEVAKQWPLNVVQIAQSLNVAEESPLNGWTVLARFPPDQLISPFRSSEKARVHAGPRFLAEETCSSNIYVVIDDSREYSRPPPKEQEVEPEETGVFIASALLSRPESNSTYKNVTVAPTFTIHRTIRVAIIWQSSNEKDLRSELYIYDIPEVFYYKPSYNHSPTSDLPYHIVQGKRITSLSPQIGGTHPYSPLWHSDSSKHAVLGGLQLPHTTGNQDNYPRNLQYQKCFVWGATDSTENCTQITCKIFDLSFADPERLRLLTGGGVLWRQRQKPSSLFIRAKTLLCACALHDDEFKIVLPNTTTTPSTNDSSPEVARKSEFWPWKAVYPKQDHGNIGSMTRDDPPARQKALKRREEWFKMRIVEMRRKGLSDFEIAELWGHSRWTRYGQIRKPDGWQER